MGLLDDAIREHLDLKRKRGADPAEVEKLEREALGPVRREPTRGSGGVVPHLQVNTQAPPPDAHPADFHIDGDPSVLHGAPIETRVPEQKRGFLRRHRQAAQEPEPTDFTKHLDAEFDDGHAAFHDEHPPFDDHLDMPTELHAMPPEAHEPEAAEVHDPQPPPLTFEAPPPPPRPTFSPQPPAALEHEEVVTGEPVLDETAVHQLEPVHEGEVELHEVVEPEAHPAVPPPPAPSHPAPAAAVTVDLDDEEPGETREWDVEHAFASEDAGHTQHAQPVHEVEEEDVLEETPEFLQDTPDHDRLWFEQRPPRDFDFDG